MTPLAHTPVPQAAPASPARAVAPSGRAAVVEQDAAPADVREFLSARLGRDFSRLPVHPVVGPPDHPQEGAAEAQAARLPRPTGPAGPRPAPPPGMVEAAGHPLPPAVRRPMERRLGSSLADVRIHSDAAAAASARRLDADAYTVGRDIVFARGRYAPDTAAGGALLAHELAHAVQPDRDRDGRPVIRRRGRTFTGFLANIFRFWDYSKSNLDQYLHTIDATGQIEGDDNSDDKARQIAGEWKADPSRFPLTPRLRVLLIREMLDGWVSDADERGILTLLEGSRDSELQQMVGGGPSQVPYPALEHNLTTYRARLRLFKTSILDRPSQPAGPTKGQGPLDEVEDVTGLAVKDLAITFRVAPGSLFQSFFADIDVPKGGLTVTITLDRTKLRIAVQPGLFIDVLGPFNASLSNVTIRLAGVRTNLGMAADLDVIKKIGTEKAVEFIQDVLTGTRFASPSYDITKDPNIVSEAQHPELIGDLRRIQYNLQKHSAGSGPSKDDTAEKLAGMVSNASATLRFTHPKGIRTSEDTVGVEVPPGTEVAVTIATGGTLAQMGKRDLVLSGITVTSSGVFAVQGTKRLAGLTSFTIGPGLAVSLDGLTPAPDLDRYLREEGIVVDVPILGKTRVRMEVTINGRSLGEGDTLKKALEGAIRLAVPFVVGPAIPWISQSTGVPEDQVRRFLGLSRPPAAKEPADED